MSGSFPAAASLVLEIGILYFGFGFPACFFIGILKSAPSISPGPSSDTIGETFKYLEVQQQNRAGGRKVSVV